ncbi:MAG: sigma-54-dependent Fis family transcriptional regulator [Acidobacteria bacterium]|nr:MAG: sigma-54-dependent Fis family transcriptional regulator [Acidobacteriota bacterium]
MLRRRAAARHGRVARVTRILFIDDEPALRMTVGDLLAEQGWQVDVAANVDQATRLIRERAYDLVLSDLRLPDGSGLDLVREVRERQPETPVLVLTAYGSVETAVSAIRLGAAEFLTKPFENEQLLTVIRRHLELRALRDRVSRLERGPEEPVGVSATFRAALAKARAAAETDGTVLLEGETGTGKEVFARLIHRLSSRGDGPFVAVNCAAIPEPLLESELFGHERGAFTGAVRQRKGRLEEAGGGVVLLDEIGEMPLSLQAKLLRVLEERRVVRLGGGDEIAIDVRFLAATSRDLGREVAAGRFRQDLFYRLNVLPIRIPPLRERAGDVPLLLHTFLSRFAAEAGRTLRFDPDVVACLERHPYPGNVRELENLVRRIVLTARGETVRIADVPEEYRSDCGTRRIDGLAGLPAGASLAETMRAVEREVIRRALEANAGHRGRTAEALGISRKNLWEKMRNHGLIGDGDAGPE